MDREAVSKKNYYEVSGPPGMGDLLSLIIYMRFAYLLALKGWVQMRFRDT